jgi:hypothetical protein
MTNLILYIRLFKTLPHVIVQDDTVYVDAVWYRRLCDGMRKSEWELDKYIHKITQCQYFSYKYEIMSGAKWKWDEEEQRYK